QSAPGGPKRLGRVPLPGSSRRPTTRACRRPTGSVHQAAPTRVARWLGSCSAGVRAPATQLPLPSGLRAEASGSRWKAAWSGASRPTRQRWLAERVASPRAATRPSGVGSTRTRSKAGMAGHRGKAAGLLAAGGQGDADDLLVVAGDHRLVGEG